MFIMTQDRCTVRAVGMSKPNPTRVSKNTPVRAYISRSIYVYIYVYFVAILTCKWFVESGYRGERLIEPSSSWFPPKLPSG